MKLLKNANESSYGSDSNGLIWGFLFPPDGPAQPVESEVAAQKLRSSAAAKPGWFIWLHFSLSNTASRPWLANNLALPDTFYHSLQDGAGGSTRVEQDGEALVAVIRDVLFDFTFDPEDVSIVSLCVQPNLLVSARLRPLRSIDRLRDSVKGGEPFRSPTELFSHLLRDQANVLVEIVRKSTERVDDVEDNLLKNRVAASRAGLGSLRRVLVRLQRVLAPEPAALFRLLSRPPVWISEDDLRDLRQAAEEFSAAVVDASGLIERLKLIHEELGALINEQNNKSLFLLAVATVLALPINIIAGLFGMNVGGIPLAGSPEGFVIIVGLVVTLTAIVAFFAFRLRGE